MRKKMNDAIWGQKAKNTSYKPYFQATPSDSFSFSLAGLFHEWKIIAKNIDSQASCASQKERE
jgi:hypothetical protein